MAEALELAGFLQDIVVSANVGYEKPRTELFHHALALAGNPTNVYMVGDNPVADVIGGRAAGMTTILVHQENLAKPDFHCRELAEIPALLK